MLNDFNEKCNKTKKSVFDLAMFLLWASLHINLNGGMDLSVRCIHSVKKKPVERIFFQHTQPTKNKKQKTKNKKQKTKT